jgi:hypothetical protein
MIRKLIRYLWPKPSRKQQIGNASKAFSSPYGKLATARESELLQMAQIANTRSDARRKMDKRKREAWELARDKRLRRGRTRVTWRDRLWILVKKIM